MDDNSSTVAPGSLPGLHLQDISYDHEPALRKRKKNKNLQMQWIESVDSTFEATMPTPNRALAVDSACLDLRLTDYNQRGRIKKILCRVHAMRLERKGFIQQLKHLRF